MPCDFSLKVCDYYNDVEINGTLVIDRLLTIQKRNEEEKLVSFGFIDNEDIELDPVTFEKRWLFLDSDWFYDQHIAGFTFILAQISIEIIYFWYVYKDIMNMCNQVCLYLAVILMLVAPSFEIFYRVEMVSKKNIYSSPEKFLVIFVIDAFILILHLSFIPSLIRPPPKAKVSSGIHLTDSL